MRSHPGPSVSAGCCTGERPALPLHITTRPGASKRVDILAGGQRCPEGWREWRRKKKSRRSDETDFQSFQTCLSSQTAFSGLRRMETSPFDLGEVDAHHPPEFGPEFTPPPPPHPPESAEEASDAPPPGEQKDVFFIPPPPPAPFGLPPTGHPELAVWGAFNKGPEKDLGCTWVALYDNAPARTRASFTPARSVRRLRNNHVSRLSSHLLSAPLLCSPKASRRAGPRASASSSRRLRRTDGAPGCRKTGVRVSSGMCPWRASAASSSASRRRPQEGASSSSHRRVVVAQFHFHFTGRRCQQHAASGNLIQLSESILRGSPCLFERRAGRISGRLGQGN